MGEERRFRRGTMVERAFNVLCLAGLLLSLAPIAISWVTADESLPLGVGRQVSAIDIMTGKVTASCPCLLVSATIFATATVFLLVSPLASLLQLLGIGVFLLGSPFDIYCGGAYYCIWYGNPGVGLVVAGIAAALPIFGMVFPRGITRRLKIVRLKERFIALGLVAP